jgi:hypothetical protein
MELNSILNSAFIKPMFNKLKNTMIEKQMPPILVQLHIVDGELKIDILETGSVAVREVDLEAVYKRLLELETEVNNRLPGMPTGEGITAPTL